MLLKTEGGLRQQREMASRTKEMIRKYVIISIVLGGLFLDCVAIPVGLKMKLSKVKCEGKSCCPEHPKPVKGQNSSHSATGSSKHKPFYVVVIDAGSTGSRLSAFTFHYDSPNDNLILDNEFFTHTEPGLSAFADDPAKAVQSLLSLLAQAKAVIPKSKWKNTPIALKATAGLKLLPKDEAESILEECRKVINESGFLVTKKSVSIMDGVDEGIYGWLTLNFLFDRLSSHASKNTFAALDLGGGSTEVTFAAKDSDVPRSEKHIYPINAFGRNISVYTQSYLGYGLMAARKEILTHGVDKEKLKTQNTVDIYSECINPMNSEEVNFDGQNYRVKGPIQRCHVIRKTGNHTGNTRRLIDRFYECEKIIDNYVSKIDIKPIGLQEHEVYAFSYFFVVAAEVGLIDPVKGGVTTVSEFQEAAKTICGRASTDNPFLCLDLTFISVLLHKGFGLEFSKKISLYSHVNDHMLSWALGAAFKLVTKNNGSRILHQFKKNF